MSSETTRHINVRVIPRYLPELSDAEKCQYAWTYTVTLENTGHETVQLINRYWHITDGRGFVQEVYGAGVVGKQPTLRPCERFEYSSWVMLDTPTGIMKGNYEMQTIFRERFTIAIPTFTLDGVKQDIAEPQTPS